MQELKAASTGAHRAGCPAAAQQRRSRLSTLHSAVQEETAFNFKLHPRNMPALRPVLLAAAAGSSLQAHFSAFQRQILRIIQPQHTCKPRFFRAQVQLAARTPPLHRAARFDFLSLANNHCLDYGAAGLLETQRVLQDAGIACAGAGLAAEAARPAIVERAGLRIAFLSFSGGAASGRFQTASRYAWPAVQRCIASHICVSRQRGAVPQQQALLASLEADAS